MMLKGLYLDDIRYPDDTKNVIWDIIRTPDVALILLQRCIYDIISLDHDLGYFKDGKEITGYDVLMELTQRKMDRLYVPSKILIHSANVVAVERMEGVLARYWNN